VPWADPGGEPPGRGAALFLIPGNVRRAPPARWAKPIGAHPFTRFASLTLSVLGFKPMNEHACS